ncbi:MAG: MG2 domain-containing protein [Caldilineaceae bacterium]|nr:MG2 domain-containing protein [Caldilineaceae bacterium]MDE0337302.1 MG2 domain-containing protein [Caldilineaceae bacterium]
MFQRFLPTFLPILIAFAALGCNANRSQGPDTGGSGLTVVRNEGPTVAFFDEESLDDFGQCFDESGSPPFSLGEGQPDWDPGEARPPLAETTPLTQQQIQALLTRLPPLHQEEGDVAQVRLPDQSLPPPRPGKEVELPFPPPQPESPLDVQEDAPLAVLRFSPEGDVPLAPQLSVTFSQPMVSLTSHQELAAEAVPVDLEPAVTGRWRWVGTKTLLFEAGEDGSARMPMATEYAARIAAGTESAAGTKLAVPVSWTFRTPAPTLQTAYPVGGPFGLEPVFFASFDQSIDPDAVLEHTHLTAQGRRYAVRRASEDEITADSRVRRLTERAADNSWVAFVADELLPPDTTVTVTFAAGTPSAEGPLVTAHPQSYSFRTPGDFVLRQRECAWGGNALCPPNSPLSLRFSNPIDTESFDPSLITIEPKLDHVSYEVFGDSIWIVGNTKPRATYDVTVASSLTDSFGQALGAEAQSRFRIGPMEAFLTAGSRGPITILDPYGKPSYPVYSVNVNAIKARVYRVSPEQYLEYQQWRNDLWRDNDAEPPGELVMERKLEISRQFDTLVETEVDLTPALDRGAGHLILYIEPDGGLLSNLFNRRLQEMRIISWVQVTEIGLNAFVDADEMLVWANSLVDGTPLAGVELTLWPQDVQGMTDETGSVLLSLPRNSSQLLIARRGDDVTFLPENRYEYFQTEAGWNGWQRRAERVSVRYLVYDDRKIYRPGETVSVKGWVRQIEHDPEGGVGLLPEGSASLLKYTVRDSSNNQIHSGSVRLSALGGFHFQFDLPETVNLGYAWIEMRPTDDQNYQAVYEHVFQVQEFRRPEYDVSAAVNEGPHIAGGQALATVTATYFAGGPLPSAEVGWDVEASEGSYDPPNWAGFVFGKWAPWWGHHGESGYLGRASFSSRTDAAGQHILRIDFLAAPGDGAGPAGAEKVRPFPAHIEATATVMDVNRQAWSSRAGFLLHPADLYVGLRTERYFVEQGEPLSVEVVVTDIDGSAIEGHSTFLRAALLDWEYRDGEWQVIEKETQECSVETTAASRPDSPEKGFASCSFETAVGGAYRIIATVIDEAGRRNQTELTRWVTGGQRPPSGNLESEELQLIPDSENYAPGGTAEILVQAPFYPAEGLLTLRRDGLVSSERFTMEGPTYTLQVPIEENHVPNIHLQVDLVGAGERTDDAGNAIPGLPRRPAYARGRLNLSIPALSRTLQVDAKPEAARLEPGAETTIDVTVTIADGQPVEGAEFAVVVVDEAILALTGYQLIDPINVFYSRRGRGVSDHYNRDDLLLASALSLHGETSLPKGAAQPTSVMEQSRSMGMVAASAAAPEMAMADEAAEEGGAADGVSPSIRARLNFEPLALFAPEVRTDQHGRASVSVKLPDNLTRYRVMVVAVAEDRFFGAGESSLTARLPLMVRPSAPRFLNFGDSFELPAVLQNQTDEAMKVHAVVRAVNANVIGESGVDGVTGYAVTVPANDRVEVRFPTTTASAGTSRFQFGAIDANQPAVADAAEINLPVFTPATTEAFAVYGEIDVDGAVMQPIRPPAGAIPAYGGLEVTLSSTALQTLTDAFIYLVRYPFHSSEQIASRILAVAALRDVMAAFDAEGLPASDEIEMTMDRDLQTLEALQDHGGGFPIWRRGGEVWPYHSVHVAHALARARLKGYSVPNPMVSRSLNYLRDIEQQFPSWYSVETRRGLSSYALYVRKLLNDDDPAKARSLVANAGLENLSLESIGWLLFVLTDDDASQATVSEMRRFITNRVTETAGVATIATGYTDGDYLLLHSSRRADAVLLEALVLDQPESELIAKLVRGLLGHRTAGRWGNTQENIWVLLAMDRYFQRFESQTPDFVARIWLGEQFAANRAFQGRSTDHVGLDLPMQFLHESASNAEGDLPLLVQKEGQGRLYYRLGLRYAPVDLSLDPVDHGFTVERVYEAVDDPDDVYLDEDGVWHIRAGARVRVRLTMAAPSRRVHVALVDPLPAGLEILNPELAVTAAPPPDPTRSRSGHWWWGSWYQHQNLRDERAEAFTSYLRAGVYEYSYLARATTPGAFIAPPAKAEEMYAPETFGRTGTDFIVVEVGEE